MGDELSVLEQRPISSENNGTFGRERRLNSMTRASNCRPTIRLVRCRGTRRGAWSRPRARSRQLPIVFQPVHCWAKRVRVGRVGWFH